MKPESAALVEEIQAGLKVIHSRIDWQNLESRREELSKQADAPDLWDNPEQASKILQAKQKLENQIQGYEDLNQECKDLQELAELGVEENEPEVEIEAHTGLLALLQRVSLREKETLLTGDTDANDAYLEINAGAGGTDACDWADILSRMYRRWAENRGYKVEIVTESAGDEAGIRSVTLEITGEDAYGWLKTETGVHRLVRISPFDSQGRRHTAFASVWAVPVVDDTIQIEILEKDIRIDTFRASGPGGQHRNKTDSAIRITHLPTGIIVTSSEKSQKRNRTLAMNVLKSRLYAHEQQLRDQSRQEIEASKTDIGWGHQIRSYVLQPKQMVKDARTGLTRTDADAVLNGDLDAFMSAELARLAV